MTPTDCELIDGFLGKWLSEVERLTFERHLAACAQCQRTLQEQQRIDRLLSSHVAPVPPLLAARIERRIQQVRRRRLVTVGAGLLAASVLLGVLILEGWTPQSPVDSAPKTAGDPPAPNVVQPVQVTFAPTANVIAVPKKTGNPNVTIIWLYPTVQTALQADAPATDPNSNDERSQS